MKKRLITSALPYVNNIPHLGNLIQVLSADVFARFCRMRGYETLYICGTDEYGTATETRALEENISPRQLCDHFHQIHREIYKWFGIEFDHFGRSSSEQQSRIVQAIYAQVEKAGFIHKQKMEQTFCTSCERFLADRYIHGTCPRCDSANARGDQCEDCSAMLDPTELKEPRCGLCGKAPERRSTEHLFLDLPALKEPLEIWLEKAAKKGNWAKNALQMTRSWIRDGLKMRCITRDLSWGVSVPGMPGKVFYVWFDAPIGYISITADFFEQHKDKQAEVPQKWQDWWQNPNEVELFQFIGKDNIPFHTVLFPSTQLASQAGKASNEGPGWTMLHHMSSSEYLNYESGKFSKSRGVGIFGNDCRETGIPADCWRFYLYYNRPERSDYQFTWADFQQLINRELIGKLGNLVHRSLSFLQRFFGGRLLPFEAVQSQVEIQDFLQQLETFHSEITNKLERAQLKDALHQILAMAGYGNKVFQETEPWAMVRSEKEKAHAWLTALAFLIHDLAICIAPYLPDTASRIVRFLGLPKEYLFWKHLGTTEAYRALAAAQQPLPEPQILFRQLEDQTIAELRKHFAGTQQQRNVAPSVAPATPEAEESKMISPDPRLWAEKIDLRVGRIIEIENHPNAERLFVEKIDCGEPEPRTIVSGLREHYQKEELLGKNVAVVANLKPAKLRGIKSIGMLLAASQQNTSALEVLHPSGNPGDRIVAEGFEDVPVPQKRATSSDFFAIPLVLKERKALLQDSGGNRPLLIQSGDAAAAPLCSIELECGSIG